MMSRDAPDRTKRGENVPETRARRNFPWSTAAAIFGGACILVSGWGAYVTGKNNALMEARSEKVEIQINDVKARQDRLEARLLFLEQNRTSIAGSDTTHVFGASIAQTDADASATVPLSPGQ